MKKTIIVIAALIISGLTTVTKADEGMWLLPLLKKYNEQQLKEMGLTIPIEQLSGADPDGIAASVVMFGSGCTGSVLSENGLVLTNYHCSYDAIRQHSSAQRDIFKLGFWAADTKQELPVNGLSVTINRKVIDISDEMKVLLADPSKWAATAERDLLKGAITVLNNRYQRLFPGMNLLFRSYFNNKLHVLYVQEKFDDIRLVGIAPKSVAKFGGETDNWKWPRQSADFAVFRIYASASGKPVPYAPSNVPLKVEHHIKVSSAGYQEGDLAMSMGFPFNSSRYAPAAEVKEKMMVMVPPVIAVRQQRLAILDEAMKLDDRIRLLYAAGYAGSANQYKDAVGFQEWSNRLDLYNKKKSKELSWAGNLSDSLDILYAKAAEDKKALQYLSEVFLESWSTLGFVNGFGRAFLGIKPGIPGNKGSLKNLKNNIRLSYGAFDPATDRKVAEAVLKIYMDSIDRKYWPDPLLEATGKPGFTVEKYIDSLYRGSVFAARDKLFMWMDKAVTPIKQDPLFLFAEAVSKKQFTLFRSIEQVSRQIRSLQQKYDQLNLQRYNGPVYPDADRTIRFSYGKIEKLQYEQQDFPFQMMFSSMIKKGSQLYPAQSDRYNDYLLHPQLLKLWEQLQQSGDPSARDMPVTFITNGDVTGGNSGSPMLNARGELIGLVFDCNWESMTRSYQYEPLYNRVICVDIRYILRLTEFLSGSKRIVDELLGT
ncbi:S46 family peptidase [Pseudobacter ginsenosidimutans]|uniref:Dipeptidyl-peptidase n=1 Tax=Pseudobacter ginsenosidimutans TaxID=661488 RepID=A0A4Q7MQ84_9BACT|nr:S46 family peptidase [Pseudobacter ginsenosidimutans]QEC42300.1 S46 family peptidase [Pseudobacter ginsenosidimutans]RZS70855.1 peptidase S46-like protein [Pseudobacter ginsenosidimutans]